MTGDFIKLIGIYYIVKYMLDKNRTNFVYTNLTLCAIKYFVVTFDFNAHTGSCLSPYCVTVSWAISFFEGVMFAVLQVLDKPLKQPSDYSIS